jgi:hypothetical protein
LFEDGIQEEICELHMGTEEIFDVAGFIACQMDSMTLSQFERLEPMNKTKLVKEILKM